MELSALAVSPYAKPTGGAAPSPTSIMTSHPPHPLEKFDSFDTQADCESPAKSARPHEEKLQQDVSPVKSDAGESAAALLMMLGAASAPSPTAPSGVNLLCDSEVEDVEEEDYKENVLDEDDEYNSGCEAAVPQFAGGHFRAAAAAPMLPKATKTKGRGAHAANVKRRANEAERIRHFGWKLVKLDDTARAAGGHSHCWWHPEHGHARSKKEVRTTRLFPLSRPWTRRPKTPPALTKRPPSLSLLTAHACTDLPYPLVRPAGQEGRPLAADPQARPGHLVAPRSQLKQSGRRALQREREREELQSARPLSCFILPHVCVCVCPFVFCVF